ncbi:MAG: carbohydrate-binding protein [Bacteroidota bacterium]
MKTNNNPLRASITVALLTIIASISVFSQDPGFFLDDWAARSAEIPDHEMVSKLSDPAMVKVKVQMDSVLKKVPPYLFGNNAVTWENKLPANPTAMNDLYNLNPRVLRWPAGSGSNEYFWNASPGQRPADIPAEINPWYGMNTENWQMSLDEYYALRSAINSNGSICVNYSYARYGTGPDPVANAAHLAADWVRYDKGRTTFWEIGNENYGSWEKGHIIDTELNQDGQPATISGTLYGQHCRVFIDSMRSAAAEIGAEIKIGVVVFGAENSWTPIETNWNEGMMPEVGDLADYLVVHSYFTPYDENSTVATILNSHDEAGKIMKALVADMAEAGHPMLPVAMTEWNIFAVGSMQMVSYISGVHAALVLGEYVLNGYGLAARWDLVNGWNNGDDHGMFSTGDEPGVELHNPRPAFFYMYFWQKYMGDRMVASAVEGANNVVAYASSFSTGECGMVLINKGRTGQIVEVEIDSMEQGRRYYTHTLTGGPDNGDFSRKVFLNGYGTDEEGGGPDEYESIKALACETGGGIRVELPPLGVVYLMVEKMELAYASSRVETDPLVVDIQFTREVGSVGTPSGFVIAVNGTDTLKIDTVVTDPANTRMIHVHLEQAVLNTDVLTISFKGENVSAPDGDVLQPFTGEVADNLLPGSAPVVKELYTNEAGSAVHLTFLKDMQLQGATAGDFILRVASESDSVLALSGVSLDAANAKKIIISTTDQLYAEHQLYLSYTGSEIQSTDGGILTGFDSLVVENNSPGLPPEVSEARVNVLGSGVEVSFSKNMMDLSDQVEAFHITADGTTMKIIQINWAGNGMSLYIEGSLFAEQEVQLSYSGTTVMSEDRGLLAQFSDMPVTNDLVPPYIFEIPGVIDAENFMYNSGMELEACSDIDGGQNLGSIDPGDYVDYRVNVTRTGAYKGIIRTAAIKSTGTIRIQTPFSEEVDREWIQIPITGGWQTWSSVPVSLSLEAGIQTLRLLALTDGYNINWLSLEPGTATYMNEPVLEEISIYPNPAGNHLTIEAAGKGFSSLTIMDITGSIVLLREFENPTFRQTLDLDLHAGLYMVKVGTGSGVSVSRLIVL